MSNDSGVTFIIIASFILAFGFGLGILSQHQEPWNFDKTMSTLAKASTVCNQHGGIKHFSPNGDFRCKENGVSFHLEWRTNP